ncbi:protein FAM111A-like [Nematolebias whitei]|uniref:protein FAM111A-like n=1 Tax=Nematolebias whitei TaxID=451745 RepID=UPI0018981073|nr:protein FAM111A-like [Nematolebias whitei]
MANNNVESAQKETESILNNENDASLLQNVTKEVLHSTHSFGWRWSDKPPNFMTCNKFGTVEDSLKRSSQFKKLAAKCIGKELVIIRDGKALSTHFPCTLIQKDDCLTVKFVKAVEQPKRHVRVFACQNEPSCELVVFHVLAKGGRGIVKVMRNPSLRTAIHEVTVYAYKGEKVKQAIKRDGRFLNIVFKKNSALSCKSGEAKIEFSNLVDDLSDKTFQVILLSKGSAPHSQSGSLEEAYLTPNENQPQSDSEMAAHLNKTDSNADIKLKQTLWEIPNSNVMRDQLYLQFKNAVKTIKPGAFKLSRVQNLFRVEFGQSAQRCKKVKTMKTMMELSDSVCQVRVNGEPYGTGFLLFGCYVLTNAHVIKDLYNENREQLTQNVSLHFSYESVEDTGGAVDVEEVVCFEYTCNVLARDWALLKLKTNQTLPARLLKHLGFPSKDGGICIIGHPNGGVKKIDPCLIVPFQKRTQVVERQYLENQDCIQLITDSFFEKVAQSVQQQSQNLYYGSCFHMLSSGSPVFNNHGNIIAMHTGGYNYETARGEPQSVIEFGHPLSVIMEHLIIHMVERKKVDLLKEYLACRYNQNKIIMKNVKELVESRNLTSFRNTVNDLVHLNDVDLKEFCEFFLVKEETVPMDIE